MYLCIYIYSVYFYLYIYIYVCMQHTYLLRELYNQWGIHKYGDMARVNNRWIEMIIAYPHEQLLKRI